MVISSCQLMRLMGLKKNKTAKRLCSLLKACIPEENKIIVANILKRTNMHLLCLNK